MNYPRLCLLLNVTGPPTAAFEEMIVTIRPHVLQWVAFCYDGASISPYSPLLEGLTGAYTSRNRGFTVEDEIDVFTLSSPHADFGVVINTQKPLGFGPGWDVNFPKADVGYVKYGSGEDVSWRATFVRPGVRLAVGDVQTTPSQSLESLASRSFLDGVRAPVG